MLLESSLSYLSAACLLAWFHSLTQPTPLSHSTYSTYSTPPPPPPSFPQYKDTKPFLLNLIATQGARIVLVANHEGVDKYEPCGNGGVLGCISLPDPAVTTWEDGGKKKALLDTMFQWVDKAPPGTLFMMCGGPLSKALIAAAWDRKPTHQYVDFGSSMDEVLKGRTTRPYMREDTSYSRTIDPQWYCDPPNAIGPDGNCGTLGPNDPDLRWPTS